MTRRTIHRFGSTIDAGITSTHKTRSNPMFGTTEINPRAILCCPPYFLEDCREASRRGNDGYQGAGYELYNALECVRPHGFRWATWYGLIRELDSSIEARNEEAILSWFDW